MEQVVETRPTRRRRSVALMGAGIAGAVVTASVVIYQASYAAFSTTTQNDGNSFTAGQLALTDNDSNSALFTASALVPGSTSTSCITVSYAGSARPSAPIELYVKSSDSTDTPGSGGASIAPYLDWSVETADGSGVTGSGSACTSLTGTTIFGNPSGSVTSSGNMLSDFLTTYHAYDASGSTSLSSGWRPLANVSSTKVFRFTYTLASDAPSTVMGSAATLKITWEAQS